MSDQHLTRRVWITASLATVVGGCQPWPVLVYVVNVTSSDIKVRVPHYSEYQVLTPSQAARVQMWGHNGVFGPPSDWISETFEGLDIEFEGKKYIVTREDFARSALYEPSSRTYEFKGYVE